MQATGRKFAIFLCLFVLFGSSRVAFADGKILPQLYAPVVQTPDQQAFISFSNGVERLVIETSIAGAGTNFVWVLPLPSPPQIEAVSEEFFPNLRKGFRSRLIHRPGQYYVIVILMTGLSWLGWRSVKDESEWIQDAPVCLAVGVAAWFFGGSVVMGALMLALSFYARIFTRSPANLGLVLVVGIGLAAATSVAPKSHQFILVDTLGDNDGPSGVEEEGVEILSRQRAGLFDSTVIQSASPHTLLEWLEKNRYQMPESALPGIRHYIDHGWVFVATKIRRDASDDQRSSLHPLAFTFTNKAAIYPMRLTGIENGNLAIDLFVFGDQQAAAQNFRATRCDRVAFNAKSRPKILDTWLRIPGADVVNLVGDANVGTKLSATLTPAQMSSDVDIQWKDYASKGASVYSRAGARTIALNVATPIALIGWLLIGASRGGLLVNEQQIRNWRMRLLAFSMLTGLLVYFALPKVEIQEVARRNPHSLNE